MAETLPKLENEQKIVEKAKTDDRAFEILYNHYFSRIYAYVIKRTGHQETAEDIVSATFMKVFTNLDSYSHQGYTFGAWVYRIATNTLIDHYRKTGKRKTTDLENAPDIRSDDPHHGDVVDAQFQKEVIQEVLAVLPEHYQEIISLKFFAELSNQEIATALAITPNNAGVIIHRALKKFHEVYEEYAQ